MRRHDQRQPQIPDNLTAVCTYAQSTFVQIFEELKRRNVLRVAAAYVAVSWLLIQVVETLFPVFELSDAAIRNVVIVLAAGFVPVVI